jgi:TPR repeat protein
MDRESAYIEAVRAKRRRDYVRALEIYEELIKEDDPFSLVALGDMYVRGEGTPLNVEKAEMLYRRAASLGSVEATLQLATVWQIRGDLRRYFLAIEEAARLDSLVAKFYLGLCYAHGRGTRRDPDKALELISAAAEQGYIRAKVYLARRLLARPQNPLGYLFGLVKLMNAIFQGLVISMVSRHDERVR